MYYDYPEAKEAYDFRNEYMFGDQILVAPITTPMQNGLSTVKVWLPEGNDWFEWTTGTLLKGGQTVERSFTLTEYPVYVKAGSVLPLYNRVTNLNSNNEELIVHVFPGGSGAFCFLFFSFYFFLFSVFKRDFLFFLSFIYFFIRAVNIFICIMINIMPKNMPVPGCPLNEKILL